MGASAAATRRLALVVCCALAMTALSGVATARAQAPRPPTFAYYYIWFNTSSWERAKTDYPLLGRYASDERDVMRRHIRWAKQTGIDGFIVSWKGTSVLNSRLEKLIRIATQEHFKLTIIYQGLDFERRPLPASQVERDLGMFERRYAKAPPFRGFEKPVVIWSGTWRFSPREVAQVTGPHRRRLLILATEKNVQGYQRLRGLVDGDAYYWSSVNPGTFPGYEEKLQRMAEAAHGDGGLWFAPAAAGFDARQIGGKTVVDRADGDTLRREIDAARGSSPDALGLISWNEFSENSHIEPSEAHGARYLRVLADVLGAKGPDVSDFESDAPGTGGSSNGIPVLVGLLILIVGGLVLIVRRGKRGRRQGAAR